MQQALAAGVEVFPVPEQERRARKTIYETALMLARTARTWAGVFIVNDHADIAAAVDADGVHLGQDDLPIERRESFSAGTRSSASRPTAWNRPGQRKPQGADYIGFGPIFATSTKDAGDTQGRAETCAH